MNDARYMYEIEGFSSNTGLIKAIQTKGTCFPSMEDSDYSILSEEYYAHSSLKKLSPIMRKWVNDAVDINALIDKIANALVSRYGRNWERITKAYFLENYKPLDNYNMIETKTPRVETTNTINTGTDIVNEQKSKVYGFNSTNPVGDSENEVTTTGDKTKNETTSVTSYDGIDTLERSGNIGVTTSMQMLIQEVEGRQYDFWKNVFADIDRLLCFVLQSC